jgi:pentatricopeptide repeat protein
MLENVHSWDEALSVYVTYRSSNPNSPDSAWPEANFYFMKKAFAKIPPVLEPKLKSAQSPHPNTYRTLAHAYEKLGMLKDARRVWQALVKVAPDDRAAQRNLQRLIEKIGA